MSTSPPGWTTRAGQFQAMKASIDERRAKGLVLPDHYACETCGKMDMTIPKVVEVVEGLGLAESQMILCRCEEDAIARTKEQRTFANLPHESSGQEPRTFKLFDGVPGTEAGLKAALAFVKGEGAHILTLVGKSGRGKSYLLEAIGRGLLAAGVRVRYEHTPTLLGELRRSFEKDSPVETSEIEANCNNAEVLLLDDIGLESTTAWTIDRVTTFVDARYRSGRRLAVATNKTYQQMASDPDNFRLASRLYDTETGSVAVAYLTGVDYRRGKE